MSTLRRRSLAQSPSLSIKTLFVESWKTFVHDWKDTFSVSIWLVVPAVLLLAVTLVDRQIPNTIGFLPLIVFVIALCVQAWVSVRLIRDTLKRAGEPVGKAPTWQVDVLTYVWTKLLNGIAVIGALVPFILGVLGFPLFIALTHVSKGIAALLFFGGTFILAIPAIWLAISLLFWPYMLVGGQGGTEQVFTEMRGRRWISFKKTVDVLIASYKLVHGRFWYTFIRLLVPGFIFGMILIASITLVDAIIQFIAGPEKIAALFGTQGMSFVDVHHAAGNAYAYFLQAVGEAAFFPLFIVWQTKIFQSLREKK